MQKTDPRNISQRESMGVGYKIWQKKKKTLELITRFLTQVNEY